MDSHRESMNKFLETLCKSKTSPVLTDKKYNEIKRVLKDPNGYKNKTFKHKILAKGYQLMDLPGLDVNDALVIPKKKSLKDQGFLRVIPQSKIYDIMEQVHCKELQHSGYKKCREYVQRHYSGITTSYITEFCKKCPACQRSQPNKTHPPICPILVEKFMERIQIDLIDMRHSPDGEFTWIGHFADHMTRFHILFPLRNNSAPEVARLIEERVLAYVGPPHIFHSDRGKDFVNELLHSLRYRWSSDNVTFVNGHPRHSQSQGLIKRGNRVIESKIAAMRKYNGYDGQLTFPWVSWLPKIMFTMNTQSNTTTKKTSYESVFGQMPLHAIVPGATKHIVHEESIEEIVPSCSTQSDQHSAQPSQHTVPLSLSQTAENFLVWAAQT